MTYPLGMPDATHGYGYIGGTDLGYCAALSGSVTVHELTWGESDTVTSAAISLSTRCDRAVSNLFLEVRLNSARSIPIAKPSAMDFTFGDQWSGRWSSEQTMTFTAVGADPSVFGAVSIVRGGETFTVSRDTCSTSAPWWRARRLRRRL